jgi:hypothetical protein
MPVLTGRRQGPRRIAITPAALMTWIAGLVLLVSAVALFAILTVGNADAARSAYTQAHGVRETATVVQVHNTFAESCSGGPGGCGGTWSAVVLVRLPQPVGGQAATTVEVPYKVSYQPGDTVTALVDPESPGYAELPGVPMATRTDVRGFTIGLILIIIASATSVFFCARWWRRVRRTRRPRRLPNGRTRISFRW